MPQATSAQREPSMEEILASIRRIIEDSDTSKRHPSDSEIEARRAPSEPAARAEVDAFRSELRSVPEPTRAPAAQQEPLLDRKPATLADIQADLRKALVEPAIIPPPAAPKPVSLAEVPSTTARQPAAIETAPQVVAPAADDRSPIVSMADIQALLNKDAPAANAAVAQLAPVETRPVAAAISAVPTATVEHRAAAAVVEPPVEPIATEAPKTAPSPVAQPVTETPKGAIISQAASRQVAAAFGELSEAFAASRQKSFDQMAEEMMRPMLQEWFDNNLPVLVERLVREEIERVARGS